MSSSHPVRRREKHSVIRRMFAEKQDSKYRALVTERLGPADGTHSSPSWSRAFPYCPPPLSRGPAEPAAASFCAAGVWFPAPKHPKEDMERLSTISTTSVLCLSDNLAQLIYAFCFISPSPGPVVRPVEASDPRRSTHEPCSHKGRAPGPAASHTPDPSTSVQRERQLHWWKETRPEKSKLLEV